MQANSGVASAAFANYKRTLAQAFDTQQADVNEAHVSVRVLTHNLQSHRQQLDEQSETSARLQARLSSLEKELQQLHRHAEAHESELRSNAVTLRAERDVAVREMAALQQELTQLRSENEAKLATTNATTSPASAAGGPRDDVDSTTLAHMNTKLTLLEETSRAASEQLRQVAREAAQTEQVWRHNAAQLEETRQHCALLIKANEQLLGKVSSTAQELALSTSQFGALKTKVAELEAEKSSSQHALVDARSSAEHVKALLLDSEASGQRRALLLSTAAETMSAQEAVINKQREDMTSLRSAASDQERAAAAIEAARALDAQHYAEKVSALQQELAQQEAAARLEAAAAREERARLESALITVHSLRSAWGGAAAPSAASVGEGSSDGIITGTAVASSSMQQGSTAGAGSAAPASEPATVLLADGRIDTDVSMGTTHAGPAAPAPQETAEAPAPAIDPPDATVVEASASGPHEHGAGAVAAAAPPE